MCVDDPVCMSRVSACTSDRAQLDQIQAEVQSEVDKAVEFAVAAPYPNVDKVDQDVYA